MLNSKRIPTEIEMVVDYPNGSKVEKIDVKTLSNEDLMNYASMGEPAALYELKSRIKQNSQN